MVRDNQARRLRKLMRDDERLALNAAKAGMDKKTARKYLSRERLSSEMSEENTWRTREDPFQEVWSEIWPFLELNPGWRPRRSLTTSSGATGGSSATDS
jgi:hypothetical protein